MGTTRWRPRSCISAKGKLFGSLQRFVHSCHLFTFQHVCAGAAGIISANGHSQDAMATSGVERFEYKDLSTIILDGVLGTLEPKEVNHMVEQPSNQGFYDTWFGQTKK